MADGAADEDGGVDGATLLELAVGLVGAAAAAVLEGAGAAVELGWVGDGTNAVWYSCWPFRKIATCPLCPYHVKGKLTAWPGSTWR